MDYLLRMTKQELMKVRDFTVTKENVGRVTFLGNTDVRGLDIDKIVQFKEREIVIYPNDADKPPVGQGVTRLYCYLYSTASCSLLLLLLLLLVVVVVVVVVLVLVFFFFFFVNLFV
jgi:hypothetical protein